MPLCTYDLQLLGRDVRGLTTVGSDMRGPTSDLLGRDPLDLSGSPLRVSTTVVPRGSFRVCRVERHSRHQLFVSVPGSKVSFS